MRLREELKPVAEKRLKRGLVLFELGKVEDIQIKQEELETEASQYVRVLAKITPRT